MSDTKIEWTDKTWSPVTGCTPASAGCVNCWARVLHERRHKMTPGPAMPPQYLQPFSVVQCHEKRLGEPLHWRKPQKIAVCLGGDLFHPDVPAEFIQRVLTVAALTPQHTYQILTKRPERMRDLITEYARSAAWLEPLAREMGYTTRFTGLDGGDHGLIPWPLPNVWLGVSVEDQTTADARIPLLLRTSAAVRFVSLEPLLGPVNLREMAHQDDWHVDALDTPDPRCRLHWVIVGGESGPAARPCDGTWITNIIHQCKAANVPVFVKQLGANVMDADGWVSVKLKARKGNDPSEWPESLRVREFPHV